MLLDATSRYIPAGVLPENCLNGSGFAISKEGYSWIELETNQKTKLIISADFTISEDIAVVGKVKYERTGYNAQKSRIQYFVDGEEKYLKECYIMPQSFLYRTQL